MGLLRSASQRIPPTVYGSWIENDVGRPHGVESIMENPALQKLIERYGIGSKELKMIEHYGLTTREVEVFHEMISNQTTQQIAEKLGIVPDTVVFHIKSMLRRTGAINRHALAGIIAGLYKPPSA